MTETAAIWAATAPFLLVVWVVQRIPGVRGAGGLVLAAGVGLGVLFINWFGHWLPFWSAGLSANFSVIMAVLLVVAIFDRASGAAVFRPREWKAAWIFGAAASLLLYPSALGLGPQNLDAYALGWPWLFWNQSLVLFGGAGLTAAILIWRGNRFGYVVLLALLGYTGGFQESENVWDYLLDPVYGAVSLLWVAWQAVRSRVFPPRTARSPS